MSLLDFLGLGKDSVARGSLSIRLHEPISQSEASILI